MSDPRKLVAAAYGVHLFTASGALCALLALFATLEKRFDLAFLWLGIAAIIDGVDGTFARKLDVETRAPRYDGAVLDLVIDYVTYVFVPAIILIEARALPPGFALFGVTVMCVTAALYFADTRMKTEDGGFLGFPAVWNVVAFYLVLYAPPPWISLFLVLVLSAGQFAPITFTHPMRVKRFRWVNLALLGLWTLAALAVVAWWNAPPAWASWSLGVIGGWFMVVGALPHRSDGRHATGDELRPDA